MPFVAYTFLSGSEPPMPLYEYEHTDEPCEAGLVIELSQGINDPVLTRCPFCQGPVKKIISLSSHTAARSDAEIRDAGFTKLVKRDDGVYENVTKRHGESGVVSPDDARSLASMQSTLSD